MQDIGNKLEAKLDDLQETLSKEIQDIKLKQEEMKNSITEIKNSLEAANSRIQEAEEWISEVDYRLKQSHIHIHIDSYQNFRIPANQKSTTDTQTKKNQLKYNTKDSHQTRIGQKKKRREEKRATKTNPKQLINGQ